MTTIKTKMPAYIEAINAFVAANPWTTTALFSRDVDDLAARFSLLPEDVRPDIRRAFMARSRPPANMMNIHTRVARPSYRAFLVSQSKAADYPISPKRPGT